MHSGMKPPPSPRSCASSLACMVGTVNTSCPPSRPTVTPLPRCTESATATRCWRSTVVGQRLGARGQGMVRRHREDKAGRRPAGWLCMSAVVGRASDSRRWPGRPARGQRLQRAGQRFVAQAQAGGGREVEEGSRTAPSAPDCEMMPSAAIVSCGSQPVATRLTRLAIASISSSSRPPSRSSSARRASGGPGGCCGRTAARPARPRSGARGRSARWAPVPCCALPQRNCRCG
jgi:hypothetical protein